MQRIHLTDPVDTTAVLGAPRWHTRPLGADRLELSVSGRLSSSWALELAARLARLHLNIERGHAFRDRFGFWMSRFEVVVPPEGDDVRQLATDSHAELQLEEHAFFRSDDHGGCIRLDIVETPDSVGLLVTLLTKLDEQGLRPVELKLETEGGKVYDSLWLKELRECAPRDELCHQIGRHLDQFLRA